jgi:hypothetical protein
VTPLSWAWFAVAVLVGAFVVALCVVMWRLMLILVSTRDLIEGVTKQTVPLIGEVGTTVGLVNQELTRVDGILSTAENMTRTVGGLVNVISGTVTSPLVKASAFAFGLRRAAKKAAEDGSSEKRRRRGRRGR